VVTIYTDGACLGNPGPGGYAAIVLSGGEKHELGEGYRLTTNNRMEMMAAIAGLKTLQRPSRVRLFSDSQYLINGMTQGWARSWKRNGWRRSTKEPALNPDLWEELLELDAKHSIQWIWVRGHTGDPMNEACDQLSVQLAKRHAERIDEVYEAQARGAGRRFR
jgi:ribonuclease HI